MHVDQQQHPRTLIDIFAGLGDLLHQRVHLGAHRGRHGAQGRQLPRMARAAETMASAARPWVTTTTPTSGSVSLRIGHEGA